MSVAILVNIMKNKSIKEKSKNFQGPEMKEKATLVPGVDEITKYGGNDSVVKLEKKLSIKNSTKLYTSHILNTNSQISINKRNKSVILTTCLMVICFTLCW